MIKPREQFESLLVCTDSGELSSADHVPASFEELYNPGDPTLAIYGGRSFEGAELLSVAAAELRARNEPSVNVVIVFPGTFADEIYSIRGSDNLFVRSGGIFARDGEAYHFDLAVPIPVDMVEHGQELGYKTPTVTILEQSGIPLLRSAESYKIEPKPDLYKLADVSGIKVPKWTTVDRGQQLDRTNVKHLVSEEGQNVLVLKPSEGFQGEGVRFVDLSMQSYSEVERLVSELLVRYPQIVACEYIDALPVKIKGEKDSAWNVRVIGFNGFCGSFVRSHRKYQPGNHERGANMHLLESLKPQIEKQYGNGFYDHMLARLSEATEAACQLAPNTPLGLDFIINKDGEPVLIEVNVADFGAFRAIQELNKPAALEAAQKMVSRLARIMIKSSRTAVTEATRAFSIFDATARYFNRFVWEEWEAYYDNPGGELKHLTTHRKSLEWLVRASLSDVANGDKLYAASYLLTLDALLEKCDETDELVKAVRHGASIAQTKA